MRISHSKKFIFLSNPMCGSSSVRYILDPYTDIKGEEHPTDPLYMLHINARGLKSYFEHEDYAGSSVGPWDEYYKFTLVRNPWKKMVSYYFFYRPDKNFNQYFANDTADYDFNSQFHHGFNDWLDHVMNEKGLPSYDYFCRSDEQLLLDDVFKIENINETLPEALSKNADIQIDKVPRLNPDYGVPDVASSYTNWKGDYYTLYNDQSTKIIEQVYQSDIENFNYVFGE